MNIKNRRSLKLSAVVAGFFSVMMILFALFYWVLNSHALRNENMLNSVSPAFAGSEVRKRAEFEASKGLLLSPMDWWGDHPTRWQGFNPIWRRMEWDSPAADEMAQLRKMELANLSPLDMVETQFKKYGWVKMRISNYRDLSNFDQSFPGDVLGATLNIHSNGGRKSFDSLRKDQKELYGRLVKMAPKIRSQIFGTKEMRPLWLIGNQIRNIEYECEGDFREKALLRQAFYGCVLSEFGGPGMKLQFLIEPPLSVQFKLYDFFHMSMSLATCNFPSDVVPVSGIAKFAMWMQLIISYIFLGVMVGVMGGALQPIVKAYLETGRIGW